MDDRRKGFSAQSPRAPASTPRAGGPRCDSVRSPGRLRVPRRGHCTPRPKCKCRLRALGGALHTLQGPQAASLLSAPGDRPESNLKMSPPHPGGYQTSHTHKIKKCLVTKRSKRGCCSPPSPPSPRVPEPHGMGQSLRAHRPHRSLEPHWVRRPGGAPQAAEGAPQRDSRGQQLGHHDGLGGLLRPTKPGELVLYSFPQKRKKKLGTSRGGQPGAATPTSWSGGAEQGRAQ